MLARALILKTASLSPVERAVRLSRLFRPLVRRFIAGDTLQEALQATHSLLEKKLKVTLDNLGENTSTEAEALRAKQTFIDIIQGISSVRQFKDFAASWPAGQKIEADPLNISIKLTQCGLDLGDEFAEKTLRDVLDVAAKDGNFVRVDMEGSDYTERTLKLMDRVWAEYKNTGTVLQSYLYRTDEDVEHLIELGMRVRLVKGAYLEPASVAYPEKSKVDEAFVRQSKRLLESGFYPAIATHDESIIRELKAFAAQKGIDPKGYEYQMLYGIRRDLQEGLIAEGFNVRVYVPYGEAWYPYFTRRLAERPANIAFIAKALFKG